MNVKRKYEKRENMKKDGSRWHKKSTLAPLCPHSSRAGGALLPLPP